MKMRRYQTEEVLAGRTSRKSVCVVKDVWELKDVPHLRLKVVGGGGGLDEGRRRD